MSGYGPEETIRVGDLVDGDWVEVIPTQEGVRGVKIGSGVQEIGEGHGWTTGRGRTRLHLPSTVVTTRLGAAHIPSHFSVVVRREVAA